MQCVLAQHYEAQQPCQNAPRATPQGCRGPLSLCLTQTMHPRVGTVWRQARFDGTEWHWQCSHQHAKQKSREQRGMRRSATTATRRPRGTANDEQLSALHSVRPTQAHLGGVEQERVDDLVRNAGGGEDGRQGRGCVGQGPHGEGRQGLGPQVLQVALRGLQEVLQPPLVTLGFGVRGFG